MTHSSIPADSPGALQELVREALGYHQAGDLAEAERLYRQVLAIDAQHADARHLLGMAEFQSGRLDEAAASIRRAIAIKPDAAAYHANLGNVLYAQAMPAEAGASYQRALLLRPDLAEVHLNLGNIYRELGDLDSSLACYQRAQTVNSGLREAGVAEAMILLMKGEYAAGWKKFENRWGSVEYETPMRDYAVPQWKGENLGAGRLLVWGEQGIGDEIQFASLMPDLLRQEQRCILDCDARLKPLFARSFPQVEVVAHVDAERLAELGIAAHLPAGSLPGIFRRSAEDFAQTTSPYLFADAEARDSFRKRCAEGRKLVGVAWHTRNRKTGPARSVDLSLLTPLMRMPGIRWVSLQYGDPQELEQQGAEAGAPVFVDRAVDQFADLDGFAAQVAAMDLVITIDNSTAHLAGALGVPTWVLLPFAPDWRWLEHGNFSLWYPTMRLFRQPAHGDWRSLLRDVESALEQWAVQSSGDPRGDSRLLSP